MWKGKRTHTDSQNTNSRHLKSWSVGVGKNPWRRLVVSDPHLAQTGFMSSFCLVLSQAGMESDWDIRALLRSCNQSREYQDRHRISSQVLEGGWGQNTDQFLLTSHVPMASGVASVGFWFDCHLVPNFISAFENWSKSEKCGGGGGGCSYLSNKKKEKHGKEDMRWKFFAMNPKFFAVCCSAVGGKYFQTLFWEGAAIVWSLVQLQTICWANASALDFPGLKAANEK